MKRIEFTSKEFKDWLRKDPRVSDEFIKEIELPFAFSSGSKFIRKYILQRCGFEVESNIPSDWFRFSQMIEEAEIDKNAIIITYDEDRDTHPPLMSRT